MFGVPSPPAGFMHFLLGRSPVFVNLKFDCAKSTKILKQRANRKIIFDDLYLECS